AAGLGCPFPFPFPDGAGAGLLADCVLRAFVASGLSDDSCAQYCSSVSLSQSVLGQSSSSSRLRCWRERPFDSPWPLPDLRRLSGPSWPRPAFGGADLPRLRAADISPEGKSAAGNSSEGKSAAGNSPEAKSAADGTGGNSPESPVA